MKKKIIVILTFIYSCNSLTLISPGITSEYRLGKSSSLKFEESSFYGTNIYQINVFYIENENRNFIFQDPNNILDFKIKEKFENNISDLDILLLAEICFDKEKFKKTPLDLILYDFELNGNRFLDKIEYIYPYSFSMKGNKYSLEKPLLIHDNYPNQKNIIKTSDDFVTCSRTILKFNKDSQNDGKNRVNIITPRNSIISFEYLIQKGKFVIQNNEEIEFNVRIKHKQ
ncbi:hypothetical protein ND856_18840 [Leptospira bandrabouensis]|uniref:Lipoprotein n=1 Tax=Leptospira bandrabouensis TaxID=2484903 RepID=A0A6H3NNN0_9LEPT|nr:hypothetical protein [Leptospira bandrabouensis]MCW7479364.1 hypothetical protein [Leptospira bandrabouensis]MCW7487056.1 hypothetical protein [Leptospira bandrabouensis]TGN10338.1 hypothetical protein EHR08_19445 [Leptospira bandrabouensis]